jgi:hypothetical protein
MQPKYVEVTIKFKTKTFDVVNASRIVVPSVVETIQEKGLSVTNITVRKP